MPNAGAVNAELPFDQLIKYDIDALSPRWLHIGLRGGMASL